MGETLPNILIFVIAALAYGAPFLLLVAADGQPTLYSGLILGPFGGEVTVKGETIKQSPGLLIKFQETPPPGSSVAAEISSIPMGFAQICGAIVFLLSMLNVYLAFSGVKGSVRVYVPAAMSLLSIPVYVIYFVTLYTDVRSFLCTTSLIQCSFISIKTNGMTIYFIHASLIASVLVTPLSIYCYLDAVNTLKKSKIKPMASSFSSMSSMGAYGGAYPPPPMPSQNPNFFNRMSTRMYNYMQQMQPQRPMYY